MKTIGILSLYDRSQNCGLLCKISGFVSCASDTYAQH